MLWTKYKLVTFQICLASLVVLSRTPALAFQPSAGPVGIGVKDDSWLLAYQEPEGDTGRVWVFTRERALLLPIAKKGSYVYQDDSGKVWIGTSGFKIYEVMNIVGRTVRLKRHYSTPYKERERNRSPFSFGIQGDDIVIQTWERLLITVRDREREELGYNPHEFARESFKKNPGLEKTIFGEPLIISYMIVHPLVIGNTVFTCSFTALYKVDVERGVSPILDVSEALRNLGKADSFVILQSAVSATGGIFLLGYFVLKTEQGWRRAAIVKLSEDDFHIEKFKPLQDIELGSPVGLTYTGDSVAVLYSHSTSSYGIYTLAKYDPISLELLFTEERRYTEVLPGRIEIPD